MDEMVGKYFKRSEFECRCGCGFNNIDKELVKRLDKMREALNMPIVINSGCRCKEYNRKVGGASNSAHTRGKACDIRVDDSTMRFKLIKLAMGEGFFMCLGLARGFLHVDVDDTLPAEVFWLYV